MPLPRNVPITTSPQDGRRMHFHKIHGGYFRAFAVSGGRIDHGLFGATRPSRSSL